MGPREEVRQREVAHDGGDVQVAVAEDADLDVLARLQQGEREVRTALVD